jgi:electron transfer flavoprotein alpha subunit
MGAILVVGLGAGEAQLAASAEVVTLAHRLSAQLKLPAVGTMAGAFNSVAIERLASSGLAEMIVSADQGRAPLSADHQVAALGAVVELTEASVILAPHTLDSAEWIPLLGARVRAAVATDCVDVSGTDSGIVVAKMICGGAIGAEYHLNRRVAAITITPGVFEAAPKSAPSPIRTIATTVVDSPVVVVEEIKTLADAGPALKQAPIVVAGGLGVGGRDHWSLITDTASALGAAVGATRAVVESGWAPYSHQVGYSGAKVAPTLYVAIGISGAVHHLAGISQAKTIVAINTDPTAEIFKVSRFGVIGDARAVVPAFAARLRELRKD